LRLCGTSLCSMVSKTRLRTSDDDFFIPAPLPLNV
jgi:hypothetical protein